MDWAQVGDAAAASVVAAQSRMCLFMSDLLWKDARDKAALDAVT